MVTRTSTSALFVPAGNSVTNLSSEIIRKINTKAMGTEFEERGSWA